MAFATSGSGLGPVGPAAPGGWQAEIVFPSSTGPAPRCLSLGLIVLLLICVCAWTPLSVGRGVPEGLGYSCLQP